MDRRKLGWILGLLAGGVIIALIMPWGSSSSKSPQEQRRDQIREEMQRELESSIERAVPPPVDERAVIEQRLERMRDERNRAQLVVDRSSRGEQVDPAELERARKTVADLIPQIEAEERALRDLD